MRARDLPVRQELMDAGDWAAAPMLRESLTVADIGDCVLTADFRMLYPDW